MVAENLTLDSLYLLTGSHDEPSTGLCIMEATALLAGEPHGDHPLCVSTLLTRFATSLNDTWDDIPRQALKPLIPLMMGTARDDRDEARSYLALDWLVRTYAPAFLDLASLGINARQLRNLAPITDQRTLHEATAPAQRASDAVLGPFTKARDALDSEQHPTWVVAYAGALNAARASGGNAARIAAWDASWGAERAEIFDDIWAAGWFSAWLAAHRANWTRPLRERGHDGAPATAMEAAWDEVARVDVVHDQWATATRAAAQALAPTVERLRISALTLFYSLINPAITKKFERRPSLAEVS